MRGGGGRPWRRLRQVRHATLAVRDLGRARDLYARVANLVPTCEEPGRVLLRSQFEHH